MARQLDRVAEAASSVDTGTRLSMRKSLLRLALAVRQLYTLTKPILGMDCDDVLDRILLELHRDDVDLLDALRALEEIEARVIKGLERKGLLIRVSTLRVE